MKKILLTMVAAMSMTAAMAQTDNTERKAPKKMTHEEMTTQMTSKLGLTDEQKTKVAALNKEYQDYMMPTPPQLPENEKAAIGKDGKKGNQKATTGKGNQKPELSKDGKKGNMQKPDKMPGNDQNQAKRQEYEKKLKSILSDDQYSKYQKMGPQGKDMVSKDNEAKSKQKKMKQNK